MSQASRTPELYQELYRRTVRPLAAHLRRLGVTDAADLDDVLQDTYVEAFTAFASLRDDAAALAWLMTIGRRQAARHRARRARMGVNVSPSVVEELPERAASPERQAEARSLTTRVAGMIEATASEHRRAALRMFYLEDATLPEIARATGVTVSTLTTWLSRFRVQARRAMADVARRQEPTRAPSLFKRPWRKPETA
jgi:RNA polymerase sigma-70 factor (ECF subfamily)